MLDFCKNHPLCPVKWGPNSDKTRKIQREKRKGKREKDKKIQKKSFTKGRGDGNINGHSTRESSERTLKTEQERIKHNVN